MLGRSSIVAKVFPKKASTMRFLAWENRPERWRSYPCAKKVICPSTLNQPTFANFTILVYVNILHCCNFINSSNLEIQILFLFFVLNFISSNSFRPAIQQEKKKKPRTSYIQLLVNHARNLQTYLARKHRNSRDWSTVSQSYMPAIKEITTKGLDAVA